MESGPDRCPGNPFTTLPKFSCSATNCHSWRVRHHSTPKLSTTDSVCASVSASARARVCKRCSCIASVASRIRSFSSRDSNKVRFVAPGMAASVLKKPYRFILVSDLDWTMVSGCSGCQLCHKGISCKLLYWHNCKVCYSGLALLLIRLTMKTKKTNLCMLSIHCGRPSLRKTVCWCSPLVGRSSCTTN